MIDEIIAGFKEGQEEFKEIIGSLVNSIALTIVYFLAIAPTSFFMKLSGKKFLDLKIESNKKTYWETLNLTVNKKEDYLKQF